MTMDERLRVHAEIEESNRQREADWRQGRTEDNFRTVWTNDLGAEAKQEVTDLLDLGYAVHVDSHCLGHTRADMICWMGVNFMRELGAHEVQPPENLRWMGAWYRM